MVLLLYHKLTASVLKCWIWFLNMGYLTYVLGEVLNQYVHFSLDFSCKKSAK